jgi:hypothetical protein
MPPPLSSSRPRRPLHLCCPRCARTPRHPRPAIAPSPSPPRRGVPRPRRHHPAPRPGSALPPLPPGDERSPRVRRPTVVASTTSERRSLEEGGHRDEQEHIQVVDVDGVESPNVHHTGVGPHDASTATRSRPCVLVAAIAPLSTASRHRCSECSPR